MVLTLARELRSYLDLPTPARAEWRRDWLHGPGDDPGAEEAVAAAVAWLWRAQDRSASADGGVARHLSTVSGWSASYPETTGYIVATLLTHARARGDGESRRRARRALEWLTSIQLPDGAFQGGTVDQRPVVPVTFNTGQVLIGLAAGAGEWPDRFTEPARRAAQWLVDTQDPDGCWRSHPSPWATGVEHTYYTHVAWGLLEAARLFPDAAFGERALANIRWAMRHQRGNGWFAKCCLQQEDRPLTHTLGYALRGVIEGYRYAGDEDLLDAACRAADGLLSASRPDGFLPGRLDAQWRPAARWACLTGSVQVAACWLLLYEATGDARYRAAAVAANRYVRRTIAVDGDGDEVGGVKGSFPIYGAYGRNEYLAWAAKFLIDAHLLEARLTEPA